MRKRIPFRAWGAIAASLSILLAGLLMYGHFTVFAPHPEQIQNTSPIPAVSSFANNAPHPQLIQCPSPILEVSSVEEMEAYLDFRVPVLDKEVSAYIVLVLDGYPTCARIDYSDGGCFNMEYGTGDISEIHGGVFDREEKIHEVTVSFYQYTDVDNETISYALWEKDGFTYSLSGGDSLAEEIGVLLQ